MIISFNFEVNWNRPNKVGKYPIYLRVTKDRKHIRIKTPIELSRKSDWNAKKQSIRPSEANYAKWNDILDEELEKAKKIYKDLRDEGIATKENLKSQFENNDETISFTEYARNKTEELRLKGNLRNHKKYKDFCGKFEGFLKERNKNEKLSFKELTPSLLSSFEVYLQSLPNSRDNTKKLHPNTIAVTLNVFKTLVNNAVRIDGYIDYDKNPFLNFKVKEVKTIKEKLNPDEINAIINLPLQKNTQIWHSRNIFLLAYYCAGIRIGDLLQLRWLNVTSNKRIQYQMGKNHKVCEFPLTDEAIDILKAYRKKSSKSSDYIFPLLSNDEEWSKAITQADKDRLLPDIKKLLFNQIESKSTMVNRCLKQIAEQAGIDKKLSTHIARHSFAMAAINNGVDVVKIKKMLNHTDLKTTQRYIEELNPTKDDETFLSIYQNKEPKHEFSDSEVANIDMLYDMLRKLSPEDREKLFSKMEKQ